MARKSLKQLIQHEVYYLVIWQFVGVLLLALFALFIRGKISGFSVLSGGLAYVLPNWVFVFVVFRFVGAQQTMQFVAAFFAGEMFKLLLSAILFLVIVKYLPVSLLSTLIGLIGAIISFWIVCLLHFSRRVVRSGVNGSW